MKVIATFVLGMCCSTWVVASSYYRDDMAYVPTAERESYISRLEAIETPTEAQYLTQIALQKPNAFVRQLGQAMRVLQDGGDGDAVPKGLRNAGFMGVDTQAQLMQFLAGYGEPGELTTRDAFLFVVQLNDRENAWQHVVSEETRDDFNALECSPNTAPSELLGPVEHQYVMQVGYPDMELTLWRFDAMEAVTYPVAVVIETTVDQYRLMDRLGFDFGTLDRRTLIMQSGDETLHCAKVAAPVLRAYHEHRREVILSDKQL